MKTILFATGRQDLEDALMRKLNPEGSIKMYNQVGYTGHLDNLYDMCVEKRPSIVVVHENLPGKEKFLEVIRKIKADIRDTRIVVIARQHRVGDAFTTALVIYNIYDFICKDRITPREIVDLIKNPRSFTDVEIYAPDVTVKGDRKYMFDVKTVEEGSGDGGTYLEDINDDNSSAMIPDGSRAHVTSAGMLNEVYVDNSENKNAPVIIPDASHVDDSPVSSLEKGTMLGYRSVLVHGANPFSNKGDASADIEIELDDSFSESRDDKEMPDDEEISFDDPNGPVLEDITDEEEPEDELEGASEADIVDFSEEIRRTEPADNSENHADDVRGFRKDIWKNVADTKDLIRGIHSQYPSRVSAETEEKADPAENDPHRFDGLRESGQIPDFNPDDSTPVDDAGEANTEEAVREETHSEDSEPAAKPRDMEELRREFQRVAEEINAKNRSAKEHSAKENAHESRETMFSDLVSKAEPNFFARRRQLSEESEENSRNVVVDDSVEVFRNNPEAAHAAGEAIEAENISDEFDDLPDCPPELIEETSGIAEAETTVAETAAEELAETGGNAELPEEALDGSEPALDEDSYDDLPDCPSILMEPELIPPTDVFSGVSVEEPDPVVTTEEITVVAPAQDHAETDAPDEAKEDFVARFPAPDDSKEETARSETAQSETVQPVAVQKEDAEPEPAKEEVVKDDPVETAPNQPENPASETKPADNSMASLENLPINIKSKILLFVRVLPSMDTVSLETAVALAASGHNTVFVYEPDSNYAEFFRENSDAGFYDFVNKGNLSDEILGNLRVIPSDKFSFLKIDRSIDYIVYDTTEEILKEYPDFVILDMCQDPFVLRSFMNRNRSYLEKSKLVYLFANYIPGYGVSEKNIVKTLDHPGYILRMEDKYGLNNNAFVNKTSSLGKKKNEQAMEYLAPMFAFLAREE